MVPTTGDGGNRVAAAEASQSRRRSLTVNLSCLSRVQCSSQIIFMHLQQKCFLAYGYVQVITPVAQGYCLVESPCF